MPKIQIDADEYLTYLLKEHQPKVVDVGDQRDPYNVIACSCMEYKKVPRDYSTNNVYTKHLVEILTAKYFSLLQYSDMR